MTTSGRMFQSRTVRGENNGDSHIMTMGCGKPDSFLVLEFTLQNQHGPTSEKKLAVTQFLQQEITSEPP